jgi:CBS domain-containing protein
MRVADVMRRSIAVIKPEASLLEAAQILMDTTQRALPVVDVNGLPIGIISEGDFLHRVELKISPPPGNWLEDILGFEEATPARRRMSAVTVSAVMTRELACVDEDDPLDEVVARMDMRHISQVLVVCGTSLVGLVGRPELLAAVCRALRNTTEPELPT